MQEYNAPIPFIQGESSTDLSDLFDLVSFGPATESPVGCDLPLAVSFFADVKARRIESETLSLRKLQERLNCTAAASKGSLPLIKLATFGMTPNGQGSLRTNGNMRSISGVEGDYDAGAVSPQDAADRLRQAGIAALIYTTPGHAAAAPRWRVLAPLSSWHRHRSANSFAPG